MACHHIPGVECDNCRNIRIGWPYEPLGLPTRPLVELFPPPQWWERPGTRPCMVQLEGVGVIEPAIFHEFVSGPDYCRWARVEVESGQTWWLIANGMRFIDGGRW